ncbi:hypothetical protein [Actinocorallia longicatena]|uniref:Secreted protein n=1 Tax=Actinocorallia longicatena TaxID=111803 RepID=A0ABP6QM05_9ACTN
MIRTALRGTTVALAIACSALLAAPAFADNGHNYGYASHNTITFEVIGGYGITVSCNTVAVAGQSSTTCEGNQTNSGGGNVNED